MVKTVKPVLINKCINESIPLANPALINISQYQIKCYLFVLVWPYDGDGHPEFYLLSCVQTELQVDIVTALKHTTVYMYMLLVTVSLLSVISLKSDVYKDFLQHKSFFYKKINKY